MKKKILISTGGSGGHTIPAISLCEHLKNSCMHKKWHKNNITKNIEWIN